MYLYTYLWLIHTVVWQKPTHYKAIILQLKMKKIKKERRAFPGSPGIKTLPSNPGTVGLIPGQGAKIPHASWPKKTEHKTKAIL